MAGNLPDYVHMDNFDFFVNLRIAAECLDSNSLEMLVECAIEHGERDTLEESLRILEKALIKRG